MDKQTGYYEIPKRIILDLIYPSVLGTFVYAIVETAVKIFKAADLQNFFLNITWLPFLKFMLTIGIVSFYCCDYLHTRNEKIYKKEYIFFDIIVILLLIISFNAINLGDNSKAPNINAIMISFFLFMGMFLIYDFYRKQREKENEKEILLKTLVGGEVVTVFILTFFFILYSLNIVSYNKTTLSIAIVILALSVFNFWVLGRKYILEQKKVYPRALFVYCEYKRSKKIRPRRRGFRDHEL